MDDAPCWCASAGKSLCKGSCVQRRVLLEPPVFLRFEGNVIAKFNAPLSLRYSGPKKDGFKYKLMARLYHSGGHFTARLRWPDSNHTFEYDGMRHQGSVIRQTGKLERQLAGVQQQTTGLVYILEGGESKQENITKQRYIEFSKLHGISFGKPGVAQILPFNPPQGYVTTDPKDWKKWKSRVTPGVEDFTWTLSTAPPKTTLTDFPATKPSIP